MPKVQSSVVSYQSSAKNKISRVARLVSGFTTLNQQGVGQIIVMVLLLAGVAIGTYVVQNRTNLIPHADEGSSCNEDTYYCEGDKKIHKTGGYQGDDGKCVYDYQDAGSCEGENNNTGGSCQYDEKYEEYECKNGYRCWNDFYKSDATSCKWESKDPHYHCDKDSKCENDVKARSDNSEQDCKNAGGTWENLRCLTASVLKGGSSAPGNNAPATNSQYDQGDCRDGAQSYKDGYAWITYCNQVCKENSDCAQNTSDGAVDPKTSNWCYGFNNGQAPRCMKLVQTDNKEVTDQNRKTTNTKAVETIKSTLAQGGNPNPANEEAKQSSSVDLRARTEEQSKQRNSLIGEMATVINKSSGSNSTVNAEISRAQTLLTEAQGKATACYTGNDKPLSDSCDAVAQAANDNAVAASRVALFDSVAAGVPETCVKVDMAVGAKSDNSLIEVAPANGTGVSRLFMCRGRESSNGAKDGDIIWQVRDDKNELQNVSLDSLNKLGLSNGKKDIASIPQDFISRRNKAAAQSGQPAYSASSVSSSTALEWHEVGVINCHNNCSSFPSGGTCYQKGTTSQYSCDGKKPTTTATTTSTTATSTEKKNLAKNATCEKNSECKSGQCNPGTSKCN